MIQASPPGMGRPAPWGDANGPGKVIASLATSALEVPITVSGSHRATRLLEPSSETGPARGAQGAHDAEWRSTVDRPSIRS